MSDLPDPLTPADCDLRGLEFMPLDTVRLLDSDLFAISTGDEFKAAVALWCKAWVQVPAGSLPDDDRVLAHLSGAGPRWRKVKTAAMRGWIKCSDGRLYHPVVAEKALDALPRRRAHQAAASSESARKEREREDRKRMFAELAAAGVTMPWNAKTSELRERHANLSQPVTPTCHAETVTGHEPVTGRVTAKTGTGTGTIPPTPKPVTPSRTDPPPTTGTHAAAAQAVADAAGMLGIPPDHGLVRDWLALPDMQLERDVLPVVRRVAGEVRGRGGRTPFKFKLFDQPIREQAAADERERERLRGITARTERLAAEAAGASH